MAMPATRKSDKKLVDKLRDTGLRKSVAKRIAGAVDRAGGGRKPPKAAERLIADLRAVAADLEDRVRGGPEKRSAAAKKAAATRRRNASKRTQSAKKGAQTRKKKAAA